MKRLLPVLTVLTIFTSCGPSTEERAAIQQKHDDSIANSVAAVYQQRETAESNKEALTNITNQYNILKNTFINYDAKLTVLYDRKKHDAEFHFGRLQSQREQQLANDERDIDNVKIQMENIKSKLQELKSTAQSYR